MCDCGKDGDPGRDALESGNRVSITGKGGEERVGTLYKKEGREEDERGRL